MAILNFSVCLFVMSRLPSLIGTVAESGACSNSTQAALKPPDRGVADPDPGSDALILNPDLGFGICFSFFFLDPTHGLSNVG